MLSISEKIYIDYNSIVVQVLCFERITINVSGEVPLAFVKG
jgi:hypothetical protein